MRLSGILYLALSLSTAGVARAQGDAPATRSLTLSECVQMALEKNLDIRIQQVNPTIARNDLIIAKSAYEPNFTASGQHNYALRGGSLDSNKLPTPPSTSDANSFTTSFQGTTPYSGLQYSLFGNVAETYGVSSAGRFDTSSGQVGINLTQPLLKNLWIDTPRLNIEVARNRLKYTESQLRLQIVTTVVAVEQAYYELIFARENVKVQEKALELADRLLAENKKRVEVGALAPLDEKQAESQVAARRADLLSAQRTLAAQQNALKTLITDDFGGLATVPVEAAEPLLAVAPVFDLQESWRKGLTQRPEMVQVKLDVERSGVELRYYRNQQLPQLDVFGTYGHGASGATTVEFSDAFGNFQRGDRPFYTYGMQLVIPLGNTAARTRYQTSKSTLEQAVLRVKKLEQDIMVGIDDSIKLAQLQYQRIDATRQARLFAEAALDAEQKKLASGKSTSFVVLQLQRDLTAARSDEIRALADFNKAMSQLYQTEGTTLEKRNVNLEVK